MEDLFRQEAADYQRQRLHGSIVLTRSLPATLLVAVLGLLTLCLLVLFFTAGFTRKETVHGMVMPDKGLIRLAAAQPGVLREVRVSEGQQVQAGDLLFVVSTERASTLGEAQTAISSSTSTSIQRMREELQRLKTQSAAQQQSASHKLELLRADLQQQQREANSQQHKLDLQRDTLARYQELQAGGMVSLAAVREKTIELDDQQTRVAGHVRSGLELQRQIAVLEAELRDLPDRSAREASALERGMDGLRRDLAESEARRELHVRAAQPGRVMSIGAEPGQSLAAGQALAFLLPEGSRLEAELYAPTRAAGFVQPGGAVLLRYDAYPYQKFGQHRGVVREVSSSALPSGAEPASMRNSATPEGADGRVGAFIDEPLYRVRVSLDDEAVTAFGRRHALKPGMQLEASLVLEHRKLYEWVLEPLFSVSGRL